MLLKKLSMFEVIKCFSWQSNFLKKQWRGQDFGIIFWEIEQKKIEFFVIAKEITVYLFCENLRECYENFNIKNVTDNKLHRFFYKNYINQT